jgi:hypothetical protein
LLVRTRGYDVNRSLNALRKTFGNVSEAEGYIKTGRLPDQERLNRRTVRAAIRLFLKDHPEGLEDVASTCELILPGLRQVIPKFLVEMEFDPAQFDVEAAANGTLPPTGLLPEYLERLGFIGSVRAAAGLDPHLRMIQEGPAGGAFRWRLVPGNARDPWMLMAHYTGDDLLAPFTEEERAVIGRLRQLFPGRLARVIEVFEAGDRNEEFAANLLLEGLGSHGG